MKSIHYILKPDGRVVPCPNAGEWGRAKIAARESKAWLIALDKVDGYEVSTVFTGLDENAGKGRPLLFETVIFDEGTLHDRRKFHCSTIDYAKKMHQNIVILLRIKGIDFDLTKDEPNEKRDTP